MKKSVESFIALNRKGILLFGVLFSLFVVGYVTSSSSAQERTQTVTKPVSESLIPEDVRNTDARNQLTEEQIAANMAIIAEKRAARPDATEAVTTFNYTGAVQTYTVPAGVTSVTIQASGAQGNSNAGGVVGGRGGQASGTLAVTPGSTLFINVGGGAVVSTTGGFNGGAAAGAQPG